MLNVLLDKHVVIFIKHACSLSEGDNKQHYSPVVSPAADKLVF